VPAALLDSTFYQISWLSSVVRLEAELEELTLFFLSIFFFLNSISVSEVLLDRWSQLPLVII
jgi:hypothetical protein